MSFQAVIVAAGSGLRAGPGEPKAWRRLGGKPIVRWSVEGLLSAGAAGIVVVVAEDRLAAMEDALAGLSGWIAVAGGETRFQSVGAGLAALPLDSDLPILIHDAARPFVTGEHVERLMAALSVADGAIPALAVADTLKQGEHTVTATVPRAGLWRAQTPQAFRASKLRAACALLRMAVSGRLSSCATDPDNVASMVTRDRWASSLRCWCVSSSARWRKRRCNSKPAISPVSNSSSAERSPNKDGKPAAAPGNHDCSNRAEL